MSQDPDLSYVLLRLSAEVFRRGPGELKADQRQVFLQAAREELRLQRLIAASPEATRVFVAESAIDEAVRAAMSRYDGQAAFAWDLESVGLDTDGYRAALRRELRTHALL